MDNNTTAMLISLVGMILNIIAFQMKNKKRVLTVQSVSCTVFMITYVFVFSWIGAILNFVNVARNLVFFRVGDDERKNKISIVVSTVFVVIAYFVIVFWLDTSANKLLSVLPIIGTVFGTVALFFKKERSFRICKICECANWFCYNASFGFAVIGAVLSDTFSLISSVVGIIRFGKKEKANG